MKCGTCTRDIADGSNFCPYCGNTQVPAPTGPAAGGAAGGYTPQPQSAQPPQQPPPLSGQVHSGGPGPGFNAQPSGGGPSQRATMSMVMGIASIVLSLLGCCCYGIPSLVGVGLGIAAFVTGKNELEDIAGGFASPLGESQANTGKLTGMIGAGLGVVMFLLVIVLLVFGVMSGAMQNL